MSDMERFRQQLFQNAAIHGGAGSAVPQTKADEPSTILESAIKRGAVDKDDELVTGLFAFFTPEARTTEGRERALKMSVAVAKFIRSRFEVRKIQ